MTCILDEGVVTDDLYIQLRRNIVFFKITASDMFNLEPERDVGMVNTYDDYRQKLESHVYTPLLYAVSLEQRIAYLYGCMNRKPTTPRDEIFRVYYRRKGTDEWMRWFSILPSRDNVE